jgi:hypothetical protein
MLCDTVCTAVDDDDVVVKDEGDDRQQSAVQQHAQRQSRKQGVSRLSVVSEKRNGNSTPKAGNYSD